MKKISQAPARAYRKELNELKQRLHRERLSWTEEWPNGTFLMRTKYETGQMVPSTIRTARRLGCAVICTVDDKSEVFYYGVKL